jgi:uncharacterized protein YbjT (DUF2867 family)
MIVITGVTGNVGREAARVLAAEGVPFRMLARDPARAPEHPHATLLRADYTDAASLRDALAPGDRVFMVSAHESREVRVAAHRTFVEAAARAGVAHIVNLSFLGASHGSEFFHAQSHATTEDLIRASGIPFTFLRTSLYSASLAMFFTDGLMCGPAGDGLVSWVDRDDCGAVVAAVLRDGDHEGEVLDVTGPEALTLAESTARIRARLGVPYVYEDADDPGRLPVRGLPDWEIPSRRSCFLAIGAGELAPVTDVVQRLTGRPPRTLDDFLLANPDAFPPPTTSASDSRR